MNGLFVIWRNNLRQSTGDFTCESTFLEGATYVGREMIEGGKVAGGLQALFVFGRAQLTSPL